MALTRSSHGSLDSAALFRRALRPQSQHREHHFCADNEQHITAASSSLVKNVSVDPRRSSGGLRSCYQTQETFTERRMGANCYTNKSSSSSSTECRVPVKLMTIQDGPPMPTPKTRNGISPQPKIDSDEETNWILHLS